MKENTDVKLKYFSSNSYVLSKMSFPSKQQLVLRH